MNVVMVQHQQELREYWEEDDSDYYDDYWED